MFAPTYVYAELVHRKGRTVLTALGLGVGVGLVIAVGALSAGLDDAQQQVLKPLTGVGSDMSVTRPLRLDANGKSVLVTPGPGSTLTPAERDKLTSENGGTRFGLRNLGAVGTKFHQDSLVSTSSLSFPEAESKTVSALAGVTAVAPTLKLNSISVSGTVQADSAGAGGGGGFRGGGGGGGSGGPRDINFDSKSVAGVDQSQPALAQVTPGQISKGKWFTSGNSNEAILDIAYAQQKSLGVGDSVVVKSTNFKVIGLSKTPLGGDTTDVFIKLAKLQSLSGRTGRVNGLNVRAKSADAVPGVQAEITRAFPGASISTSKDLADRVGGSLKDAKSLTSKLGTALIVIALIASILIASLLTLSSVAKRTRELGTLKAIGWRQSRIVAQLTGETLVQGLLGGVMGVVIGVGAALAIDAVGPTLQASVAAPATGGGPFGGSGGPFGQGAVSAGSETIALGAPLSISLILLAVALAVLGGLIAGAVGALRASRLRPADALRNID